MCFVGLYNVIAGEKMACILNDEDHPFFKLYNVLSSSLIYAVILFVTGENVTHSNFDQSWNLTKIFKFILDLNFVLVQE